MLRLLKAAASTGAALVAIAGGTVSAQWFGGGGGDCNCGAPVATAMVAASYAAPTMTACNVCAPVVQTVCAPAVQPVMQTVYRQVPVTEYQPVKQIARRQVLETKYVDQAVTAYRPITETKVAEVPTVSYQNVTECQTQYRNAGYWRTRCEPNCKMSPCQYDQRSGLVGWFNRTSYEMTSAFQPNYRTTREYVPQTIAQAVPVTRQVAIQGTRQVSYNVTRMEPYQTTQKVAISVPRWEDTEVTVMKPITVVKTMAVGTQVTYVPIGSDAARTAIAPIPEPTRRADALKNADPNSPANLRGAVDEFQPRRRTELVPTSYPPMDAKVSLRPAAVAELSDSPVFSEDFVELGRAAPLPFPSRQSVTAAKPVLPRTFTAPGAARASQWVARSSKSPSPESAPSALSVADTVRP